MSGLYHAISALAGAAPRCSFLALMRVIVSTTMEGIIVAAGKGTRLHPITLEIPKPLLTVGRRPIVQHLVDLYRKHGIKHISVTTNAADYDLFERWVREYGDKDVSLVREGQERVGTWGGIKNYLKEKPSETFVVANGDQLTDIDISELVRCHRAKGALVTLATVEVANPRDYGVLMSDAEGRVTSFAYRPEHPPSKYIMAGIYVAEPEIFKLGPDKEFISLEEDVLPEVIKLGKLYECKVAGRWHDCGTFERYEHAINDWTGKHS
jgi:mannose-1-phosphate guanylyltransferase/phosphomannomutase